MIEVMDVLLVEDNAADVDLTRETFDMSRIPVHLQVAADGDEAIALLFECRDRGVELPDLILLDLNLPRRSGHEILHDIKSNESFRHIPIIVLTSSEAQRDVVESYRLGASCYVAKPVDFLAFRDIVESIQHFWFDIAKLPVSGRPAPS